MVGKSHEPRVLLYDIETAPTLGWMWRVYQADAIAVERSWYMLSFAYKWLGDKKVQTHALPDFPLYKREPENDRRLCDALWWLFDEAEVIVAHNGDRFDQRKARARFLVHDMMPPSPFREIDTLKVLRRKFALDSNRLDDACQQLSIGSKLPHQGKHTWLGCMSGDEKSWATMRKYNAQDVKLLEALYERLLPWIDNHPNMALIGDRPDACPKCFSTVGMIKRANYKYHGVTKAQVFQCKACNGYSHHRLSEPTVRPRYK